MYIRRRKSLLLIWPIATLLVGLAMVSVSLSTSSAVVSVDPPTIIEPTLTPGSTFSIDVTVAHVEGLWGFQFVLYYNTTVLTATGYSSYAPFTVEKPSEINDTAGLASVSYSMQMGEKVGFSTVDPASIAKIDFTVDSNGTSDLTFERPVKLPAVDPTVWISSQAFDGFFANVAMAAPPDIAVIDVTASPTTVLVNETVTVNVTAENQGDADATFNVSLYYELPAVPRKLIETRTDVTLSAGTNTTLNFTWDTTGVAAGTYIIRAQVPPVLGEIDIVDNLFIDGEVTIMEEEEESSNLVLYAVAAIAIVIVAIILVYALRRRKPKTT